MGLETSYFMHWSENCIIAKAVPGSILDDRELFIKGEERWKGCGVVSGTYGTTEGSNSFAP